ncbi:MAG: hypothetical protein V7605_1583 [Acidimicrobiaceae bacterium]|jgi:hypothetical protein
MARDCLPSIGVALSPVVALVIVVVTVAVVAAVIALTTAGLGRHRSRTRDQASTIFALRTAVVALVQTSTQGWTAVDASVRPTVVAQLPLVQDGQLRQLTTELLEATRLLASGGTTDDGDALRAEVDELHEQFRWRSNEVVRELNLGRVPPAS